MASLPVYVGLDYHQDSVQVCVLDEQGQMLLNRSLENDAKTICRAVGRRGRVRSAGIEACCGAANLAEDLIRHGEWPVQLAHPGYVARLKQSPDKTDFSDARLLADLSRVGYCLRSGSPRKHCAVCGGWFVIDSNWWRCGAT